LVWSRVEGIGQGLFARSVPGTRGRRIVLVLYVMRKAIAAWKA